MRIAAVLTACGNSGYEAAGPFRPKPEGPPPQVAPQAPAGSADRPSWPSSSGTCGS